jgi:hypothetical protein
LKSLLLLWQKVAEESATRCCTSASMDVKTIHARFEHEGISFLTISLPNFGKDFERSLDQGMVDRSLFTGFRFRAGLPLLLGGFLDLVFERSSGRLLSNPSIDAILAIRQLTLMFGKVLLPCSDTRVRKAIDGFVECEKEVRVSDKRRSPIDLEAFRRISDMLFAQSFSDIDRKIYNMEIVPKHGPGATSDKLMGNQKFNQRTWTTRLESILPSGEMLLPNWSFYSKLDEIRFLEPGSETPMRVVTVPKTLKTPRIIGIEPTAMQYAQQAILAEIQAVLSKPYKLTRNGTKRANPLRSIIGLDDQTPNQVLAREGSSNGSLATLDLSEASDRVSNQLVREMVRNHPYLHRAVDASRSRKADVPGYGVVRLAKFAPMGSALCFPFEAMVFVTMIFVGIERELKRPLCHSDIQSLRDKVRVFGDDIIVPVEYVRSVVHTLELFGAKVNVRKSFWNGKFRESCGKEYYDGEDVSIVRVRRVFPTQPRNAQEVISIVSLRNQLYFAGYWQTCKWLDDEIRRVIKHFPVVLPSSPVLGRHSFLGFETQKVGKSLHNPLVKGYVVSVRIPNNPLDDMGALLKYLITTGDLPSPDKKHLERSGRPHAVNIMLRNASAV